MTLVLAQRCEIWRFVATGGRRTLTAWRTNVPCELVPISNFDAVPAYAREATLLAHVEPHIARLLRNDDEIRIGHVTDSDGNPSVPRYSIEGKPEFRGLGLPHVDLYLKSRSS